MAKLSSLFLLELFHLMFRKKLILDICVSHLQFQYLPNAIYKEIWKKIKVSYVAKGVIPTIGVIAQMEIGEDEDSIKRLELLGEIKNLKTPEIDDVLVQLEEFIKDSMTVEFSDNFVDLYNKGKKNEARLALRKTAEDLYKFSLKSDIYFEPIFGGYQNRQITRRINSDMGNNLSVRIPFGIDPLDEDCGGGMDIGDTACFLARSGVGKTKLVRHIGVSYARRGFKVLHIQLEGTRSKCLAGYDATWTAQSLIDIEEGNLDSELFAKLINTSKQISLSGGEIFVEAFEQFERPTVVDIRNLAFEFFKKKEEYPALILIDHLELLNPGNGVAYRLSEERHRRMAIAEMLKNLAVEIKTRIIAPTQANEVPETLWNDEDWVMTRSNVSEAKSLPNPFSFFITLNQSRQEYEDGIMRLYEDKIRDRKGMKTVKICQDYDHDRFYLRRKTLKEIYNIDI